MRAADVIAKPWLRAVWLCCLLLLSLPAAAQIEIVDQAGRTVRLAEPARRIIFSEPGDFTVLAMLDENPAGRIVAWNRWRLDQHTVNQWRSIDPEAFDRITQMSIDGPHNLNAEALIVHAPDLVVLDHFFGSAKQAVSQLEQAGIPVAILSLEANLRLRHPTEGIEKLAVLIGREERGKEVSAFIQEHLGRITERVAQIKAGGVELPTVLMEPHAGSGPCCLSMGEGRSMGDLVVLAGGQLIGSEIIEDMSGQLSAEYVIASDPAVYIGTGGQHMKARGGLLLGADVDAAASRASLKRVLQRVGLAHTRAVREKRAHGIWHSGFSIVNLELIATWLHPESFKDIDPAATLAEIDRRFMAKSLTGTFWTSLAPAEK